MTEYTPQWLLVLTYMPARRWMLPEEVARDVSLFGDGVELVRGKLRQCVNRGAIICRRHDQDRRRWEFRKPLPRVER